LKGLALGCAIYLNIGFPHYSNKTVLGLLHSIYTMDPLGHSSGLLGLLLLSNDIVKSGQQLKAAVKEVKSLQIQVAALFEILKALQPIIADASDQLLPRELKR
jgi:hypothetical protein